LIIISAGKLNRKIKVQECDATMLNSSTLLGAQK
jgi:hypothetical protein